jgi:hypothetical protein
MATKKESRIYWRVGKGEKHEIPSGATVTLESPKGDRSFLIESDGTILELKSAKKS